MATQRTADARAGFIVASAFFAGLAFTILLVGSAVWEPPPESAFQIDDVRVEAECLPVVIEDHLPGAAVLLATKPPPVAASPERLALADAASPIVAAIVAQALPTSGNDRGSSGPRPVPTPTPTPGSELVPTPALSVPDHQAVPPVSQPGAAPLAAPEAEVSQTAPAESTELRALVVRLQAEPRPVAAVPSVVATESTPPGPAAPLPGDTFTDPDGTNWSDPPADGTAAAPAAATPRPGRILGRLVDRRGEVEPRGSTAAQAATGRLLDRVRDRFTQRSSDSREAASSDSTPPPPSDASHWPDAASLRDQVAALGAGQAEEAVAAWTSATLENLAAVQRTGGPRGTDSEAALVTLGEGVAEGMAAADAAGDSASASRTRRAALAVARRVAVWRAAAACLTEATAADVAADGADVAAVVHAVERFETSRDPADAARVRDALRVATTTPGGTDLDRAVRDHYLSPNVRISVNELFVEKLLPESSVTTSPLHDYVLGRKVRGTKTVEQTTAVHFTPHPSEIRLDLLVNGDITSRTVTDAGSVAIHSRGQSNFTVFKPIQLSTRGLAFGAAHGSASNQSQLAGIETDFDSVPLMGSLVRGIARNQHDGNLDQATREVNVKIVGRACREVDQRTEPELTAASQRIRDRFWMPMERLGLQPTAVALETTDAAATARLRLAAPTQLAAHTPRPRAPDDALFSIQVHESTVNNACDRFGLAGRTLTLEQLTHHVCTQLGLPPSVPDDIPENVSVTFAKVSPLRIDCRDGLVHVHVALDALESGRRNNWYDIEAHVAYRPSINGMQVSLEREGPVQLGGPGQKGRMEFGLRTIFGKMFPKERPVPLVPATLLANPRLAGVRAVQAVSADGWLAVALAPATETSAGIPAGGKAGAAGRTALGVERGPRR